MAEMGTVQAMKNTRGRRIKRSARIETAAHPMDDIEEKSDELASKILDQFMLQKSLQPSLAGLFPSPRLTSWSKSFFPATRKFL